jgi:hypothetical protein
LVFGRTTTGFVGGDRSKQIWISRTKEGKATSQGGITGGPFIGKSWVEADKLCNQWPKKHHGRKVCFPVFRNPDGTFENKDEYFGLLDYGLTRFSVLDK